MSRTVSQTLLDAIANQQGDLILRVKTWNTLADYNSNPNTPDNTWTCLAFDIYSTSAKCTLVTENNYILSDFTVFLIERGATISGTEYTVKSGIYFVKKYKETYGKIFLEGSSYPNQKVSITAGDGTYEAVITAFCTAIGKTAVFKESTDAWLDYQFLATGKSLLLNKAEAFENLLKQKYTILVYEESPKNLVFYNQDSYATNGVELSCVIWVAELSLFVAVGRTGTATRVLTSPNGLDWTARTSTSLAYSSVAWSPTLGLLVAVHSNSSSIIAYSSDAITWNTTSSQIGYITSICWSPEHSLFVAVASAGVAGTRVQTSPDGLNWTDRTTPADLLWSSVCWSPTLGLFVAVAYSGTGNRVMTSPDGTTWTSRTSAADNDWRSVAWSPSLGLFVAVASSGTGNRVMTSPNGITWTIRSSAANNSWYSVCWSAELNLFVAVAVDGTGNRVMTSPDGTTWTIRTSPADNEWNSVTWSSTLSLFVAVASSGAGNRVMSSPDGITWTIRSSAPHINMDYEDGPDSYITRDQSEVHYIYRDELGDLNTDGDTTKPQWNLGYLGTGAAPTTRQDPYYKIFLQKSPVRLDITDGDKINFTPFWSIDPTKTIDAMMQVSEHLHLNQSPSWYQEIKSIVLFNKNEGGGADHGETAYTRIVSTGFDGNLTEDVNTLQALAEAVDDLTITNPPATIAANDFQVGDGAGNWIKKTLTETVTILRTSLNSIYAALLASTAANDFQVGDGLGGWIKKTLAETITILRTSLDSIYAPNAKGVTNGDNHDHSGGDGAQIAHTALSSIGTNTHAQIDTHIAASNPHSGSQPLDSDLTTIAALSPSNDDIMQRKAGAWTSRTIAQYITDITENIQDLVGAMVSGNTETGIAVTYQDSNGKLDFDAQTAGDARYAPIAKGVTNGDNHDHSGGDGAQIAYSSLSGAPTIVSRQVFYPSGQNQQVPGSTTNYLNPYSLGLFVSTGRAIILTRPCVIKNLTASLNTAQPAGGNLVVTVVDGTGTSLGITVTYTPGQSGIKKDTTNTYTVTQAMIDTGIGLTIRLANGSSSASGNIAGFGLELEYT